MTPRFPRFRSLPLVLALVAAAGCQSTSGTPARLYPGIEGHERAVTTSSAEAQRYFDQGLLFLLGFNHDEAVRSFEEAARLDPDCAMAYWGQGYAHGLHINKPEMSEEASRLAYEATQEALRRIDRASPVEAAMIEALATRYEWPVPEDRSALDEAYAAAMEGVYRRFPEDVDIGAFYAESLMNLQPWDLWTKDGEPKGRTEEIVAVLEGVLERMPEHPGATHFYIHAVEASKTPERAIPAAEALAAKVPGEGHLVHMPSHIWIRTGRYREAADANQRAIDADKAYFDVAPKPDFYSLYFLHNVHFLAYAAMMEGRYETAIAASRQIEEEIPRDFLATYPQFADAFMPTGLHVMIRFGKWDQILEQPEPEAFRLLSRAVRAYARGIALSALGRPAEAREEMARFDRLAAEVPEDWKVGNNPAHSVLPLARYMLEGEILYREGRLEEAFASLQSGVRLEDGLVYDEPPGWMLPVRHALGALLMGAGRAGEAEQVYREDLEHNPNNGWALLGLENALRAQGDTSECASLAEARAAAWARADVRPTSSCYCEPGA